MLWRELKAWQIYGVNTNVGKTILSTILSKALARRVPKNGLLYLKPVSTRPNNDADHKHISRHVPGAISKVISQLPQPVNPHLAVSDFRYGKNTILIRVKDILYNHSRTGGRYALLETTGGVLSPSPFGPVQADLYRPLRLPVILVGDGSPSGVSTTTSAFESLHLRGYDVESVMLFDDPAGDNHEYLQQHFAKHDIKAFSLPVPPHHDEVIQANQPALAEYYEKTSRSSTITSLLSLLDRNHFSRISKLTSLPSHAESVIWHPSRQQDVPQNIIAIDSAYDDHVQAYNAETDQNLQIPESGGMTMFNSERSSAQLLTPLFNASASCVTQMLGHGSSTTSLTAAYAAGRYGNVTSANAIHQPALDLSYNLLATLQNPRISRVFFTDSGSTAMEVAVKMALHASCTSYGWSKDDQDSPVGVLGVNKSDRNDTIDVMNDSEPNTFKKKTDWQKASGYWFNPPEIKMKKGKWILEFPNEIISIAEPNSAMTFNSIASIFDYNSRTTTASLYRSHIIQTLHRLVKSENRRFGALILEPLLGSEDMIFVDPLFQRTLITTIRENPDLINPNFDHSSLSNPSTITKSNWSGLPLIANETMTGLYRLGRASPSSFWNLSSPNSPSPSSTSLEIQTAPDISVHANLLTGGLLPLGITTSSASIYSSFQSTSTSTSTATSKPNTLLDKNSYKANPLSCSLATTTLTQIHNITTSTTSEWTTAKKAWTASDPVPDSTNTTTTTTTTSKPTSNDENKDRDREKNEYETIFSVFHPEFLTQLSHHRRIKSCFTIGTVLSFTLAVDDSVGSGNNAALNLQARLLMDVDDGDGEGGGVNCQVVGDVVCFMMRLNTSLERVRWLERRIFRVLDEELDTDRTYGR